MPIPWWRMPAGRHCSPPYEGRLTVGGELNKLASNIAMARNTAGIHWRSDSEQGIRLGEAVAIGLLRDVAMTNAEPFQGFRLTMFDGRKVTVGTSSPENETKTAAASPRGRAGGGSRA